MSAPRPRGSRACSSPRAAVRGFARLDGEPDGREPLPPGRGGGVAARPGESRVVVGGGGPPLLGLAGLVEAFFAILADRLQQPVRASRSSSARATTRTPSS